MSSAANVSVVVPARDAAGTIARTLDCLARQDSPPGEVIVVDAGSTDATADIAEGAGVKVLRVGLATPGGARQAGVASASGTVIAFTDADCFPAPGWLSAASAALARADLVQGRVVPDPEAAPGPFDRSLRVERESGLYETANLLIRRELFERVGGFEDWLVVDSGKPLAEDVWIGWRARRAGARTAFVPGALVHHAVFPRRAREYVAERLRLVYFPAIARQVPELRHELFFARAFLNARTAAFDGALGSLVAAAALRSPVPLAGALPYAGLVTRRARGWRHLALKVAVADVAADAVGLLALVRGSARARSLLL